MMDETIIGGNPYGPYDPDYAELVVEAYRDRYTSWKLCKNTPAWGIVHAFSRRWAQNKRDPVEVASILYLAGGIEAVQHQVVFTTGLKRLIDEWCKQKRVHPKS